MSKDAEDQLGWDRRGNAVTRGMVRGVADHGTGGTIKDRKRRNRELLEELDRQEQGEQKKMKELYKNGKGKRK